MNPTYGAKCNKCRKEKTYYSENSCAECVKMQDFLKECVKREAAGTGSNEEPSTSYMDPQYDTLEDDGSTKNSDTKSHIDLTHCVLDNNQIPSNDNPSTDSTSMDDIFTDEPSASKEPSSSANTRNLDIDELEYAIEANKENIPPYISTMPSALESDNDTSIEENV